MGSPSNFLSLHRPSTSAKGKKRRWSDVGTTKSSGSDGGSVINPTSSVVFRHKKIRIGVPERESEPTASVACNYDNSSLNSSSLGSSVLHTPSVDVHFDTSFGQSPTTVSSGDSLQQSAPSVYLDVPKNPLRRTQSLQDRRESLLSVH